MILFVTGISAGIELRFGYRWQLAESNNCRAEMPQKHFSGVGLSGVGPRRPVMREGECAWGGGGGGGDTATPLFTKNCQDNDKSEAVGPHGEWYAGCGVYKIEKYSVCKLDELPY